MKPRSRKDRSTFDNGPRVSVASVNDQSTVKDIDDFLFLPSDDNDTYFEDGSYTFLSNKKYSDEQIKVKALNLSINIAKLMSDVTVDNILKIADKIAIFIQK